MAENAKTEIPPTVLQEIGVLNVRINDLMTQLNKVLMAYGAELKNKEDDILKLKVQVVKEANKDVPLSKPDSS